MLPIFLLQSGLFESQKDIVGTRRDLMGADMVLTFTNKFGVSLLLFVSLQLFNNDFCPSASNQTIQVPMMRNISGSQQQNQNSQPISLVSLLLYISMVLEELARRYLVWVLMSIGGRRSRRMSTGNMPI